MSLTGNPGHTGAQRKNTMSITYTVHGTGSAIDGRTFTNGTVIDNHPKAGECVSFGMHVIDGKQMNVLIRTAGKPDLKAIVEAHRAAVKASADAAFARKYGKFIEEARATGNPPRERGRRMGRIPVCRYPVHEPGRQAVHESHQLLLTCCLFLLHAATPAA